MVIVGWDEHDVELEFFCVRRRQVARRFEYRVGDRIGPADQLPPFVVDSRVDVVVDAILPVAEAERCVLAGLVRGVAVIGFDAKHPEVRVTLLEGRDGCVVVLLTQLLHGRFVAGASTRRAWGFGHL